AGPARRRRRVRAGGASARGAHGGPHMSRTGTPTRAWTTRLLLSGRPSLLGFAWATPAAHAATGVSNLTASNASPSTAANALTTYAIGFKTSASGALVGSSGANITITFPSDTDLANLRGSPLFVGATQDGF